MRYYGKLQFTLAAAVALLILSAAMSSATVYVKHDSPGPVFNGASWETAFHTVQQGIDVVPSGGQVWIAEGTYEEHVYSNKNASVYGGFAGTETDVSQRNPCHHKAVIRLQGTGDTFCFPGGTGNDCVIDGLIIHSADSARVVFNCSDCWSGDASPTISRNIICGRYSKAIDCLYGSPRILDNFFVGRCDIAISCGDGSPQITGNTVTTGWISLGACAGLVADNRLIGASIGMGFPENGQLVIRGNLITGNGLGRCSNEPAVSFGGYLNAGDNDGAVIFTDNFIVSNSADGIQCSYSMEEGFVSYPRFINNAIAWNGGTGFVNGFDPTDMSPANRVVMANNIVAFNDKGISNCEDSFGIAGHVTLLHNCVYGNPNGNYEGILSPDADSISIDPNLVVSECGMYRHAHIQPNSPCRNVGDDTHASSAWHDIDGQPRIQGEHVDIGADESDGATAWPTVGPLSTIRVDPAGCDFNDGSAWDADHAVRSIQAAIAKAAELGGEVWVKGGTYQETDVVPPCVYLYGGFSGTEMLRPDRNWQANLTAIDGEHLWTAVTFQGGGALSRIDGFTIRNGQGPWGGGICCWGTSPIIANNTVTSNAGANGGGGLYSDASPTISNNTISHNTATSSGGGGISCPDGRPVIFGNTIEHNTASTYGGGIRAGGLRAESASGRIDAAPIISHNNIRHNSVVGGRLGGGGIACLATSATIIGNKVIDNSAYTQYDDPGGGGIYCGDDQYFEGLNRIIGNVIAGNTLNSGHGSAIHCDNGTVDIIGNTVVGNTSDSGSSSVHFQHCSPRIFANNIVAFNSGGMDADSACSLSHNCLYGNTDGDYQGVAPGIGDIWADPLLDSNYHLTDLSPCLEAGDDSRVVPGWPDIDEDARVIWRHVDIGADEYTYNGVLPDAPVTTIDGLKQAPDGSWVTVNEATVSAQIYDGYRSGGNTQCGFAIEKPDRSSGIRALWSGTIAPGDSVDIFGRVATVEGERVLRASAVDISSSGNPFPEPLSIANINSGGGDCGFQDAVVDDATQSPARMSTAVNNIGLLVTLRGNVRYGLQGGYGGYFYVDDAYGRHSDGWDFGTGLRDGSVHPTSGDPITGVRCRPAPDPYGSADTVPVMGFVEVTGVMGVRQINGINVRYLWTTEVKPLVSQNVNCYRDGGPWNLLSFPIQPVNPDPEVVLSGFDLDGNFYRWDARTQSLGIYDLWGPEAFGPISTSQGYWLNADCPVAVSYQGYRYTDGTTPGQDRRIDLTAGWNIIGMPFTHNTRWSDWRAFDCSEMLTMLDARDSFWLNTVGYWWDAGTQGLCDFGLPEDFPFTEVMLPWHGYWVEAYRDIALVAPDHSVAP